MPEYIPHEWQDEVAPGQAPPGAPSLDAETLNEIEEGIRSALTKDANLEDLANVDAALGNLGATGIGRLLLMAVDAAAARNALQLLPLQGCRAFLDGANVNVPTGKHTRIPLNAAEFDLGGPFLVNGDFIIPATGKYVPNLALRFIANAVALPGSRQGVLWKNAVVDGATGEITAGTRVVQTGAWPAPAAGTTTRGNVGGGLCQFVVGDKLTLGAWHDSTTTPLAVVFNREDTWMSIERRG